LSLAVIGAAVVLLTVACGGDAATSSTSSSQVATSSTATTEPAPDPSVDAQTACGVHFANTLPNPDGPDAWFTADAELTNTGNIGTNIRVKAIFKQAGGHPIKIEKKARLPYGKAHTIHIKRNIPFEEAEAFTSAPGYVEGEACSVTLKIVNTFGDAH
jgi:hypothetical protein